MVKGMRVGVRVGGVRRVGVGVVVGGVSQGRMVVPLCSSVVPDR